VGYQICGDDEGRVHISIPQQIHRRVLAGIVPRVSPGEVQSEGKAIEVGCNLIEAGHIAVPPQSPDDELGESVQLLDQVECRLSIAVLAVG